MTEKEMLAAMQTMLSPIGERLDRMEATANEQFAAIDERFASIDERFTAIDERFTAIDERFDSIDERFASIDERFASIDERFDRMEASTNERFDSMEIEIRRTRVLVEHQDHKISLVAEQYGDIAKKLDQISETSELKGRVRTLERVVENHSEQIAQLKKAN